jgi:3-deoxy-7-phosphoheptulonate synthase
MLGGMETTNNINIAQFKPIPTPEEIRSQVPISDAATQTVLNGRRAIEAIVDGRDPRLFVVVGPCSIHDSKSAMEYAHRLQALSEKVADTMVLVMRVYFEKPRTTVGWKGFINDPDMDDSFKVDEGLQRGRQLLMAITELGLPAATEALDPISPQYTADLISWYAIGARTTESQTHRELASGLSAPVGFKNSTDGSLLVAVHALMSSRQPHHFLGISPEGRIAVFQTRGNPYGHVILRGGGGRPNYDSVSILLMERELKKANLPNAIVVDCSHANSNKDPYLQPLVVEDCVNQIRAGNKSIVGLMLESHLFAGSQPIPKDKSQLKYGVSITDACIDWATTEDVLLRASSALKGQLEVRRKQS